MPLMRNTALAVCLGVTAVPVISADYDGSRPFICSPSDVMECVPGAECKRTTADAISAPRFIKVDMPGKKMTARFKGAERVSPIEHSETVDGKLMLQGIEDGYEDVRDGVGWTLSVSTDLGHMVMTASGDEVAFVLFGACTYL